jgi:diacylglycerol kinase (CTP)
VSDSVKLAGVDEALERALNGNGHANGIAAHYKAIAPTAQAKKIDWEIPRKALHSSIGFVTLYLYASHGSPERVVVVLSSALLIIVPADILRLNYPPFERSYERVFGFLMRESEKKQTNGVIWYILGVVFVLSQYPLDVALMSVLILSWADTAASTFGRLWGRYTPPLPSRVPILGLPLAPRKSLAGFLAASITGAAIVFSLWSWLLPAVGGPEPAWDWTRGVSGPGVDHSPMGQSVKAVLRDAGFSGLPTRGWVGLGVISIVSGLVTGIAEALDLGNLDDNLTLPILSGGCIWGLLKLFSWFSS